jgi:sulfate transport system ATP-binding protein
MNHGKVEQQGSPEQVYDHPASPFVFEFLGNVNLFHGRPGQQADDEVAYARPHEVAVAAWAVGLSGEHLRARLVHARLAGPSARLELELADSGETLEAEIAKDRYRELELAPGSDVAVSLPRLKTYPAAARQ